MPKVIGGKMLYQTFYSRIETLLNRIAGYLHQKGITPNQLTLAGLVVSFLAGCIYALGNFILAGIVVLIGSTADLLDGPLARTSKQASKFGAFLDSTIDRYSDFFLFGGLAVYFAKQAQGGWFLMTLGILLGSFVTSYTKARAENFVKDCRVGMIERAERIVLLALGSLFPPFLPIALWLLLVGTHATAIQRLLHVRKVLAETAQETP